MGALRIVHRDRRRKNTGRKKIKKIHNKNITCSLKNTLQTTTQTPSTAPSWAKVSNPAVLGDKFLAMADMTAPVLPLTWIVEEPLSDETDPEHRHARLGERFLTLDLCPNLATTTRKQTGRGGQRVQLKYTSCICQIYHLHTYQTGYLIFICRNMLIYTNAYVGYMPGAPIKDSGIPSNTQFSESNTSEKLASFINALSSKLVESIRLGSLSAFSG